MGAKKHNAMKTDIIMTAIMAVKNKINCESQSLEQAAKQ
jgi:hypothetical protein